MTTKPTTTPLLDNTPVAVQAKLGAAWTSFMFLYVYVDVIGFYKPGVLDGIQNGRVWEFEVSAALLTTFLVSVSIPALMIVLSTALPARANRVTNLVVASLYIPFTLFNAVGETGEWLVYYGFAIVVEVLLLAAILRWAATWPRTRAVA